MWSFSQTLSLGTNSFTYMIFFFLSENMFNQNSTLIKKPVDLHSPQSYVHNIISEHFFVFPFVYQFIDDTSSLVKALKR